MSKTVKEHIDNSNQVQAIINDANKLVEKLQRELAIARETLDALEKYQHPELSMTLPNHIRSGHRDDPLPPKKTIQIQIERINALLGDRA
ncbi:hypothetical protein NBRC116590_03120 [Pelagimonas sp. KU-00592-HH]|uniref:hypothetical protein n=1 Tax=Pelagimonas sp. KU-00592-HH TaxID=3127651 RepID=UPI00310962EC